MQNGSLGYAKWISRQWLAFISTFSSNLSARSAHLYRRISLSKVTLEILLARAWKTHMLQWQDSVQDLKLTSFSVHEGLSPASN